MKAGGHLREHFEESETLGSYRIYAEARKVSGPEVISKSMRHRSQRIILPDNAMARIEWKVKWIG
jgi:hypothetical protein